MAPFSWSHANYAKFLPSTPCWIECTTWRCTVKIVVEENWFDRTWRGFFCPGSSATLVRICLVITIFFHIFRRAKITTDLKWNRWERNFVSFWSNFVLGEVKNSFALRIISSRDENRALWMIPQWSIKIVKQVCSISYGVNLSQVHIMRKS